MQDSGNTVPHSLKQLIVRTTPDGFLFGKVSARGSSSSKLRLFAAIDFPEKFVDFLHENRWANRPELKVAVVDFTNRFMLVPKKFADDNSLDEFFQFQNGDDGEQQIYSAPLDDGKQVFCWEIPAERDRSFEKWLPGMTLWSSSYLVANWTYHQAINSGTSTLTAHFHGKHMQLFMADTKQLLFANTFVVRNKEEITYFLLRCLEQSGLDPAGINCFLCIDNIPYIELQTLLKPYLANIAEAEFSLFPDQLFRIAKKSSAAEDSNNEDDL